MSAVPPILPYITPAEFLDKVHLKEFKLNQQRFPFEGITTNRRTLIDNLMGGTVLDASGLIKTILVLGGAFTDEISDSFEDFIHFQRERGTSRDLSSLQNKGLGLLTEFTVAKPFTFGEQTLSTPIFTADDGKTWSGIVAGSFRIKRSIEDWVAILNDLSSLRDWCAGKLLSTGQYRKWLLYVPRNGTLEVSGKIYHPIIKSMDSSREISQRIADKVASNVQIAYEEIPSEPRLWVSDSARPHSFGPRSGFIPESRWRIPSTPIDLTTSDTSPVRGTRTGRGRGRPRLLTRMLPPESVQRTPTKPSETSSPLSGSMMPPSSESTPSETSPGLQLGLDIPALIIRGPVRRPPPPLHESPTTGISPSLQLALDFPSLVPRGHKRSAPEGDEREEGPDPKRLRTQ